MASCETFDNNYTRLIPLYFLKPCYSVLIVQTSPWNGKAISIDPVLKTEMMQTGYCTEFSLYARSLLLVTECYKTLRSFYVSDNTNVSNPCHWSFLRTVQLRVSHLTVKANKEYETA